MPFDPNDPFGLEKAKKKPQGGLKGSIKKDAIPDKVAPSDAGSQLAAKLGLPQGSPTQQGPNLIQQLFDAAAHPAPVQKAPQPQAMSLQDIVDDMLPKGKPKHLSGPTPNPSHYSDPAYYPSTQLPDRLASKQEQAMRAQQDALEKRIRTRNARGLDVSDDQKELFKLHEQIAKFGGNQYKSPPPTKQQKLQMEDDSLLRNFGGVKQTPKNEELAKKLSGLSFSPDALIAAVSKGFSVVTPRNPDAAPIPVELAKKMIMARTGANLSSMNVPLADLDNEAVNKVLKDKAKARTADVHLHPELHPQTARGFNNLISNAPANIYQQLTGLDPSETPYFNELLKFAGGTLGFPGQIGLAAKYAAEHPSDTAESLPGVAGQFVQSLNPLESNISGPERFGRVLNDVATVFGVRHGIHAVADLKKMGVFDDVAKHFGLSPDVAEQYANQYSQGFDRPTSSAIGLDNQPQKPPTLEEKAAPKARPQTEPTVEDKAPAPAPAPKAPQAPAAKPEFDENDPFGVDKTKRVPKTRKVPEFTEDDPFGINRTPKEAPEEAPNVVPTEETTKAPVAREEPTATPEEAPKEAPKEEEIPKIVEETHGEQDAPTPFGEDKPIDVKPTTEEEQKVLDESKNQKKSGRTGLTEAQSEYLGEKLKSETADFKEGEHDPKGVSIRIPGDGEFTVHSAEQAANLHEAVLGRLIHEPAEIPPHPKAFFKSDSRRYIYGEVDGKPVATDGDAALIGDKSVHDSIKAFAESDQLKKDHANHSDSFVKGNEHNLSLVFRDAPKLTAESKLTPKYINGNKKIAYLTDASGKKFAIKRAYADLAYSRGYELAAPGEKENYISFVDPKNGEIRGVVAPLNFEKLGEPEQKLPYKKPKPPKAKPEAPKKLVTSKAEPKGRLFDALRDKPVVEEPKAAKVAEKPSEAPTDSGKQKPKVRQAVAGGQANPVPTPTNNPRVPGSQRVAGKGKKILPEFAPPEGVITRAVDELNRIFSPASRTTRSGKFADILRDFHGQLNAKNNRAAYALGDAYKFFEKRPQADNYDFIDRMERGADQGDPELNKFAKKIRTLLDGRRNEIRKLGTGALQRYNLDYFPHLWKDPSKVKNFLQRLYSRRPLQGKKGFLKKRTYDTFYEGIKAKLVPISDNPVDIVLAQTHQMDKYITAHNLQRELLKHGGTLYVKAGAKAPEGYSQINDPTFTRYGDGKTQIHEAFDGIMMDKLHELADNLGINYDRKLIIGGKHSVLGQAMGPNIETKWASPESVFVHELGHVIDHKFKIERFFNRQKNSKVLWSEAQDLADLRSKDIRLEEQSHIDYLRSKSEMVANMFTAYVHTPDLFERVAPKLYKSFDDMIKNHVQLAPLARIEPSLTYDTNYTYVRAPGIHTLGQYYAPTDIATLLNNYLSPGLDSNLLFKGLRKFNNAANQFNLSLSLRHYIFTSINSGVTDAGLGYKKLFKTENGKLAPDPEALKHLARGHSIVLSAAQDLKRGKVMHQALLSEAFPDPATRKMVEGVISAGGGVELEKTYSNNYRKQFSDAMSKHAYATAAWKLPGKIVESMSHHMMTTFIPNIKLGAFARIYESNLADYKGNITPEVQRRIAVRAWDNVDDRFGHLQYDTLFWDKTTKQLLQSSLRSTGWSLGTARQAGGAVKDIFSAMNLSEPDIRNLWKIPQSDRVTYLMALTTVTGLWSSISQYGMTKATTGQGQLPEGIDFVFPRTGRVNADGTPERISLPTYMRDILGFAKNPESTIINKLSPALSMLGRFYSNQDYRGSKIVNEDDPLLKKGTDFFTHFAAEFAPFSLQGQLQSIRQKGQPAYGELFGLNAAPSYVGKTPAITMAEKMVYENLPRGGRTSEEAEKSDTKKNIVTLIRNGEKNKAIKAMVAAGYSSDKANKVFAEAAEPRLVTLVKNRDITAKQALKILEYSKPKEQKEIAALVMQKIASDAKTGKLKGDEIKNAFDRYHAAIAGD